MTIKKTNPTKPGAVELSEEELQDMDLTQVRGGATYLKIATIPGEFKSDGPKDVTKVAGGAEAWAGAGANA